ncbi:MAG TPA: hypothetical protein VF668_04540 [Pyrinomonadaceae bacterium]|jgi:hypothetical protein
MEVQKGTKGDAPRRPGGRLGRLAGAKAWVSYERFAIHLFLLLTLLLTLCELLAGHVKRLLAQ